MACLNRERAQACTLREVVRCHRLEHPFWLHYLCYAIWGACYAVTDARHLLDGTTVLVVVANLSAIVSGNPLNSAVDVQTDTSSSEKHHIAQAALRVGKRRLLGWAAAEMTCAVVLAAVVSLWSGKWIAVVGVALIIVLHLAYNVEPLRLKRRGYAGPVALGIQMGVLPYVVSYYVAAPDVGISMWWIAAGLGVLATGRALWWLVPDRVADRAAGISTPAVRHAAGGTSTIALGVTVGGMALLAHGLWAGYGFGFAVLGTAASGLFIIDQLAQMRRIARRDALSAMGMRRGGMSRIVFANLVLTAVPLLA
jgi:4-hydroxybenzoate polyprenyltransferase